jgi:hypothetical protein
MADEFFEKRKHIAPIVIELLGISITGIGIGLEIALGGQAYLVMITAGSLLIATGGVIWGKFMRKEGRD